MTDTRQLLADYVASNSETAFRELVACYADLVYSAAIRLVNGDAHLAEDVTAFVAIAEALRIGGVSTPQIFAQDLDQGLLIIEDFGDKVFASEVARNADQKSLKDMTQRYNELVDLARQRRLPPDATGGSIATVTNFGTFGLIWATPIPLPEQTLVLGMGAGRRAPFWDATKGQFVPVMEANLTLSFDHRVLDGGAAGRLLQRIGTLMLEPENL